MNDQSRLVGWDKNDLEKSTTDIRSDDKPTELTLDSVLGEDEGVPKGVPNVLLRNAVPCHARREVHGVNIMMTLRCLSASSKTTDDCAIGPLWTRSYRATRGMSLSSTTRTAISTPTPTRPHARLCSPASVAALPNAIAMRLEEKIAPR